MYQKTIKIDWAISIISSNRDVTCLLKWTVWEEKELKLKQKNVKYFNM